MIVAPFIAKHPSASTSPIDEEPDDLDPKMVICNPMMELPFKREDAAGYYIQEGEYIHRGVNAIMPAFNIDTTGDRDNVEFKGTTWGIIYSDSKLLIHDFINISGSTDKSFIGDLNNWLYANNLPALHFDDEETGEWFVKSPNNKAAYLFLYEQ